MRGGGRRQTVDIRLLLLGAVALGSLIAFTAARSLGVRLCLSA